MMDENWTRFFYGWILGTAFGGVALNYSLASAFQRRSTARNGVAAVVVGLLVQWGLGLPVDFWIIGTYGVPQQNQESVGYFVGPFVLAFIAFPAALFTFYRPSLRPKSAAMLTA